MRGLDTSVLVRYLAADEPRQCAAAERVFEECQRNEEPLYLIVAVLCEHSGKGDFSDHLIGEISRHAGCRDTVTFDRDLRQVTGFSVIA